mmetsp:Transcript_38165/g.87268  ORF Transcript_38165/g.87268 Transcript_38165/m.87268 type:complete len:216 (+) Transcript_38165:529-1176(+)
MVLHERLEWHASFLFHLCLVVELQHHPVRPLAVQFCWQHRVRQISSMHKATQYQILRFVIWRLLRLTQSVDLLYELKMDLHISRQDDSYDILPDDLIGAGLCLPQEICIRRVQHQFECHTRMHTFQDRIIVVANSQWVASLHKIIIVETRVANIMRNCTHERGKFGGRCAIRGPLPLQEEHGDSEHIECVLKIVIRVWDLGLRRVVVLNHPQPFF